MDMPKPRFASSVLANLQVQLRRFRLYIEMQSRETSRAHEIKSPLNEGGGGGVYMRKLAPARVSYRHDFLISYRVYMMTGLFHI